tara:strand:- start:6125 stop:6382 length:258 start_codon:yes stop_codon:yes gene_type:complete
LERRTALNLSALSAWLALNPNQSEFLLICKNQKLRRLRRFKKIKKIAPFGLSVGCLDTVRTSKLKPFFSYFCPPFFFRIVFQSIV